MSQVPLCHTRPRAANERRSVSGNGMTRMLFFSTLAITILVVVFLPILLQIIREREKEESSPLETLLRENRHVPLLSGKDEALLQSINDKSKLEFKSLVISETVVPVEESQKLQNLVRMQLAAHEDVVTLKQAAAMLEMVQMAPRQATLLVKSVGEGGSLSNSVAFALLKHSGNNIHYMLLAVKVEPHLGLWNRLSTAERNAWNDVLSRMLVDEVNSKTNNSLAKTGHPKAYLVPH